MIAASGFFALLIVFQLSAEMKMERIATSTNVAVMEYFKSCWNWSVVKFPSNAMCLFGRNSVPHDTISIVSQSSVPQPATVVNQNVRLESFPQSFARRFEKYIKKPVATIATSSATMAERIVPTFCVEVKVVQSHAQHVIAPVANTEPVGRKSIEVEPSPSCGINRLAVFGEHGSTTFVGATSPNLAWSQSGIAGGHRSVEINVLEESKNGVYEAGRHNVRLSISDVVFSGTQSVTGRLSVATIANVDS